MIRISPKKLLASLLIIAMIRTKETFVVVALLGVILVLYWVPRSQSLIVSSWNQQTGGLSEAGFFREALFGEPLNHYQTDFRGRVTQLTLGRLNAKSLSELSDFAGLTYLADLEISNAQLEGTADLSMLTRLEHAKISNTPITRITGLANLKNLKRLDLSGSSVESIESVGTAQELVLTQTRVTDLSKLGGAGGLAGLLVEDADLKQLQGFRFLPRLKFLSLRRCRNLDLEEVAELAGLEMLLLDHSDVTSLLPLRKLQNLKRISLIDTPLKDLSGLENVRLDYLGTDNPAFTAQYVQQLTGHPINLVTPNDLGETFGRPLIVSTARRTGVWLVLFCILVLLPLPRRWQHTFTVKLKEILILIVPGAVAVFILSTLANLDLPFFSRSTTPTFFVFLERIAFIIAIVWFLVLPVLIILRDTRFMQRRWSSVPLFFFSRYAPVIAFIGTMMALGIYVVSRVFPAGRGSLGGVVVLSLLIAGFVGLGFLSNVSNHLEMKRRGIATKLTFPRVLYLQLIPVALFLLTAACIVLFFRAAAEHASQIVFLFRMLFPSFFVLSLLIGAAVDSIRWKRERERLRSVLTGSAAAPRSVVEVPLTQGVKTRWPMVAWVRASADPLLAASKEILFPETSEVNLVSAQNVGQIDSLPVAPAAIHTLLGLIIIIQQADLERARKWELRRLEKLVRETYDRTWAPIWLAGDCIGGFHYRDGQLQGKLAIVESFTPFLSGIETFSAPSGTVYDPQPPDSISNCLHANRQIEDEILTEYGIGGILRDALTPVAIVLRGVFAQAKIVNRLDSLARASETAVAAFALLALAEFDSQRAQFESDEIVEIDSAVEKTFNSSPTFKSWISLFDKFRKKRLTPMTADMAANLNQPCRSPANELKHMVAAIGGEGSVSQVAKTIRTRGDLLPLLLAIRNVVTAHGPATERADFALYEAALVVTLDFLSAFGWDRLSVTALDAGGQAILYRGCIPAHRNVSPDSTTPSNLHAVYSADHTSSAAVAFDVSRYFKVVGEQGRIAFYAGRREFLEPIFGEQIRASDEVAA